VEFTLKRKFQKFPNFSWKDEEIGEIKTTEGGIVKF
jgi:hypothetical protein